MKDKIIGFITLLLIIVMLFNFASCARSSETDTPLYPSDPGREDLPPESNSNSLHKVTVGTRVKEEKTLNSEYVKFHYGHGFQLNALEVCFTNDESLKFKEYPYDYFSEIDGSIFEKYEYSAEKESRIKKKIEEYQSDTDNAKLEKEITSYHTWGYLYLKTNTRKDLVEAMKAIEMREDLLSVTPFVFYMPTSETEVMSADPGQWAFDNVNYDALSGYTQKHEVTVGILDTGIDTTHPDLIGRIDLDKSRDYSRNPAIPGAQTDEEGHGTHVAGIIAATTGNSIGIDGMSKTAKIISLKVFGVSGMTNGTIIAALEYATEIGIDILNMSLAKDEKNVILLN